MTEILTTEFVWAVLLVGGVIGLVVLAKAPELLVAVLLVGPNYIQFILALFGYQVTRREFAAAGGVIFIPVVLVFLVARMVGTREREPIIGRPNIPFIITAVVMGIWLVIGLTYTDSIYYGPRKTAEYFIFGLAPMLLVFVFLRDRAAVRRLLVWSIIVTASVVFMASAYSLATKGTIFARLAGVHPDEETLGMEIPGHGALSAPLVMTMGAVLALAAGRTTGKLRSLPVLALPIVAFYVVLAGTRSNLVSFLAVTPLGFFLTYRRHKGVFVLALMVLAVAGVLLYLYAPEEVQTRMFSSWIEEGTPSGHGGHVRIRYLTHAPAHFMKAPVQGSGTGSWPLLEAGLDTYSFPHNMFVEAAIENGIVGLALVLGLWFLVVRRLWRHLTTAEPGTELYGIAVFGVCLLAIEATRALAHFGIAHGACTLLLTSGITLRATYLEEEGVLSEERPREETDTLIRPVLRTGPLA